MLSTVLSSFVVVSFRCHTIWPAEIFVPSYNLYLFARASFENLGNICYCVAMAVWCVLRESFVFGDFYVCLLL